MKNSRVYSASRKNQFYRVLTTKKLEKPVINKTGFLVLFFNVKYFQDNFRAQVFRLISIFLLCNEPITTLLKEQKLTKWFFIAVSKITTGLTF